MRAFISHSTKNKAIADNIVAFLEGGGVTCWIAPRDITPGINYGAAISAAVRECSVLVLVYSEHSNASDAVFREVQLAFDSRKPIIPLRIDNTKASDNLNFYLSGIQWVDAAPDQQDFTELAESIRQLLMLPQAEPVTIPFHAPPPQFEAPPPYYEAPRRNRASALVYGAPIVLFILGVVGFGVIVPRVFEETISFFAWLTTNPVNVASMISTADELLASTSSVVVIQAMKYVWLGLFILSLFFLGRRLQAKPVPAKNSNAIFTGREPLFAVKEAHSALKLAAKDEQLADLTRSVRILEEKLAVESDFGVGDSNVILCENEIALQLNALKGYTPALCSGDYMNLVQAKTAVTQINSLLERRREMKKR